MATATVGVAVTVMMAVAVVAVTMAVEAAQRWQRPYGRGRTVLRKAEKEKGAGKVAEVRK